ncbi:MAG: hypothetical protein ACM3N0_12765, partial [Chloroflexota bacterium]
MGFLELTGGPRGDSGGRPGNLDRLRLALAVAALAVGADALVTAAHAAGPSPRPVDLRCIEGCAGK